jgi:hypothetical protein
MSFNLRLAKFLIKTLLGIFLIIMLFGVYYAYQDENNKANTVVDCYDRFGNVIQEQTCIYIPNYGGVIFIFIMGFSITMILSFSIKLIVEVFKDE